MAFGSISRHAVAATGRHAGRAALAYQTETALARGVVASSNVGCSYRQPLRTERRTFSTTSNASYLEGIRNVFKNVTERSRKAAGYETEEDKRMKKYLDDLKPDPEKSRKRLLRKRWSRPVTVPASDPRVRATASDADLADGESTGDASREIYTEHKYSTARFRISERKLQMLADQIGGGKPLDYAMIQMQFSHKRAASRIKSMLALARDHAIAKGLDPAKLVVAEAWVGKGRTFKKLEIKGRGRMGIMKSHQAYMSVVLREGKTWATKLDEKLEKEKRIIRSIGTGGVVRTNRPFVNAHQRPAWQW